MKRIFIFLIKIYQKTISPFFPLRCRFTPTCSEYTIEAIERFGIIKGCYLGIKRIIRCNPLCKSHGFDPVPEKEN